MKDFVQKTTAIVFLILSMHAFAQEKQSDCIVLVPGLKGEYVGKCKKGLAHGPGIAKGEDTYEGKFKKGLPHGEGTYNWSNGDIYEGDWKKGEQHGYGKMSTVIDGNDTILDGYWKEGEFIGKQKNQISYKVINRRNVDRVTFVQKSKEGNTIYVNFYRGGYHCQTQSYIMNGSSGFDLNLGLTRGYRDVEFPFKGMVDFTAFAKMSNALIEYKLEFEIFEKGTWDVFIWI